MQLLAHSIGFACVVAAVLGSAHALFAAVLVGHLARDAARPRGSGGPCPGVTILKPLHGAESELRENLATFLDQQYDGPVQVLFGVKDESDAAAAVVASLLAQRRDADAALVVAHSARGINPKVSTLTVMERQIRHGIVVLADSDIGVPRDYLARIVDALHAPGVGLVTCLYRGRPSSGRWARLASMAIDCHFVPGVLVGLRLRLARPCFGATIALSRVTLEAIGGFAAFVDHLADDHAMGEAVRATGRRVAVPPLLVDHTCAERSFAELARHELRWARTIRAVQPVGYAASLVAHPIPLALLACALLAFAPAALAALALSLAARLVLAVRVDHTSGVDPKRWRLVLFRDLLSFAIFVASFFVAIVTWRGRRYRVRRDGTLAAVGETPP